MSGISYPVNLPDYRPNYPIDTKGVELAIQSLGNYSETFYASPIGAILAWSTSIPPAGWLICDGSAVSRSNYSALFAVIGTQYGAGDGSTTFNLPNLKGKVPVGLDSTQTEFDTLGETGGAKTHTLSQAEMPVHAHGMDSNNQIHNNGSGYTHLAGGGSWNFSAMGVGGTQNAGGGAAHNNLQPYQVVNYIICFKLATANSITPTMPYVIGQNFSDYNPLPTTMSDVPGSALTFTLQQTSTILVDFGIRFQINSNFHCRLNLNIDGSDVSQAMTGNGDTGVVLYFDTTKNYKTTLAAGNHTIKLRANADTASASVGIEPRWFATIYPQ